MYVSLQLIHFIVQWKLTEYYKETVPQVGKKKERERESRGGRREKKEKKSSGRVPAVFRKPDSRAEVSAESIRVGHGEHLLLQLGPKVTKCFG